VIMTMTDERHELATTVRRLLQKHLPESELRQLMSTDTAQHPKIWAYLADMGLLGLAIPEQYGGAGYGWSEVGVVLEEAGRALLCVPFYSTAVLATAALLAMEDTPAQADLLPGIAAGECIATVALSDDAGNWGTPGVAVRATNRQGTWRLEGHANYVLDGGSADIVLVPATSAAPNGGGVSLFVVDRSATGLNTTPLSTLDLTRKQTRLEFHGTPGRLIGSEGGAGNALETVKNVGVACLAAEQVGGAQSALEMAVEYAKTRYQFGRPIGSFQAVKHMCADMLVEVELARSAAYHALWAADDSPEELPIAACIAKITCPEAYFSVAAQNIQVHGGIGFTWEHAAHLHLKRAKSGQLMLGDAIAHSADLADRIGIALV
jgi:alkylation response protein AidB-like acyl-CoA dehydrogenase